LSILQIDVQLNIKIAKLLHSLSTLKVDFKVFARSHKSPYQGVDGNVKLSTVSESMHCPHRLNSNSNRYVGTLH